jgi:two-component system CheB/CheR fusion protein
MKKHLYDPPLESRSKKSSDKGRLKYEDLLTNIINKFLPPSVIIDANYLIIKVINDINPFSQIQAGHYSNELFSILPKDLGLFVNNFLRQLKNGETEHLTRKIAGLESFKDKIIELSAKRIQQENHLFFLVSFSFSDENTPEKDIKIPREEDYSFEKDQRLIELEKELKTTRENLAATVEELESANEELQSSNEELVASNEELQSTNEELQSVNEELYTVNSEHQEKIQELTNLNNDINNLLKNTEIAAIYLDSNLCIRKITPQVSKITNIIEADLGRPINHLTVMETYPEISEDAEKIMETLQPIDKEIIDNENKPYFVKLRPYRTENNAVEGIMITIIEITELKALQDEIQQSDQRLSSSLDLGSMAWWEYDVLSRNVIYDDRKATMLGYKPEDFPNDVYAICDYIHSDDYEPTMQKMRDVLEGKKDHWEATYRMKRKDGSYAWFRDRGSVKTRSKNGIPQLLIGMVVDISDYQTLENDLSKRKELLNLIFENTPITTVMVNSDGQINYANKKAEELFNITKKQIRNRSFNSAEWKITGLNHKPVDSSDLPFSIIKKSRKPVYNYQHYIKVPGRDRKLLTIDGAPVISNEEHFIGAVFTIKAE